MTSEELGKMKKHCENLAKECDSYKDMIWTKDKAIEVHGDLLSIQRHYLQLIHVCVLQYSSLWLRSSGE